MNRRIGINLDSLYDKTRAATSQFVYLDNLGQINLSLNNKNWLVEASVVEIQPLKKTKTGTPFFFFTLQDDRYIIKVKVWTIQNDDILDRIYMILKQGNCYRMGNMKVEKQTNPQYKSGNTDFELTVLSTTIVEETEKKTNLTKEILVDEGKPLENLSQLMTVYTLDAVVSMKGVRILKIMPLRKIESQRGVFYKLEGRLIDNEKNTIIFEAMHIEMAVLEEIRRTMNGKIVDIFNFKVFSNNYKEARVCLVGVSKKWKIRLNDDPNYPELEDRWDFEAWIEAENKHYEEVIGTLSAAEMTYVRTKREMEEEALEPELVEEFNESLNEQIQLMKTPIKYENWQFPPRKYDKVVVTDLSYPSKVSLSHAGFSRATEENPMLLRQPSFEQTYKLIFNNANLNSNAGSNNNMNGNNNLVEINGKIIKIIGNHPNDMNIKDILYNPICTNPDCDQKRKHLTYNDQEDIWCCYKQSRDDNNSSSNGFLGCTTVYTWNDLVDDKPGNSTEAQFYFTVQIVDSEGEKYTVKVFHKEALQLLAVINADSSIKDFIKSHINNPSGDELIIESFEKVLSTKNLTFVLKVYNHSFNSGDTKKFYTMNKIIDESNPKNTDNDHKNSEEEDTEDMLIYYPYHGPCNYVYQGNAIMNRFVPGYNAISNTSVSAPIRVVTTSQVGTSLFKRKKDAEESSDSEDENDEKNDKDSKKIKTTHGRD